METFRIIERLLERRKLYIWKERVERERDRINKMGKRDNYGGIYRDKREREGGGESKE